MTSAAVPGGGPRVCVLSGGALKTVAHLGILGQFRERGLDFELYLGCSGGALMAALMAGGIEPRRAFEIFRERARGFLLGTAQPRSFGILPSWFAGFHAGLADAGALRPILSEFLPADTFDGLPGSLGVNAIHLRSGIEVLFTGSRTRLEAPAGLRLCRRQPVSHAVSASISLPAVFKPTLLPPCGGCPDRTCGIPPDPREPEGGYFIDGGFRSHLPLAGAWAALPSFVLACDARFEGAARRLPVSQWSLTDVLHRTGDIAMRGQVERMLDAAPAGVPVVSLSPPNWESALFDTAPAALERSWGCGGETARRFLASLGVPSAGPVDFPDLVRRLPGSVTVFAPEEA